jgi:hypothetical protein
VCAPARDLKNAGNAEKYQRVARDNFPFNSGPFCTTGNDVFAAVVWAKTWQ